MQVSCHGALNVAAVMSQWAPAEPPEHVELQQKLTPMARALLGELLLKAASSLLTQQQTAVQATKAVTASLAVTDATAAVRTPTALCAAGGRQGSRPAAGQRRRRAQLWT